MTSLLKCRAIKVSISPHSHELTYIDNNFNHVKTALRKQELEKKYNSPNVSETFIRVKQSTLLNILMLIILIILLN